MPTGKPKPATAEQVAMYGHSAATLRAALKVKGWKAGDLNQAMGKDRSYSPAHVWLNAKGAPGVAAAKLLGKILDIDPHDLLKRGGGDVSLKQEVVRVAASPPVHRAPGGDQLTFSVDREGVARIKLDLILPYEQATPLLRLLLDAGCVMAGRGE